MAAANCGGGAPGCPIMAWRGGIPACMNIGAPATTGAPWTLDMTGAAAAAWTMPPGAPAAAAVVAAADIVAGLGAPLLGVIFCRAYRGIFARCSSCLKMRRLDVRQMKV